MMATDFALTESANVLSPKDMLALPRPGAPLPNDIGDLAIVPITTHSFQDRKSHNSLSIVALGDGYTHDIPLPDGGDAFWLDSRTIAHVVTKDDTQSLYTIPVSTESPLSSFPSSHVGSFPISTASTFRYNPSAQRLMFSAYVYPDGLVETVKEQDTAYENRGDSGLVYDETFARHWDKWVGPKRKALIGVSLAKVDAKWVLGQTYVNVLKGTGLSSPVEPFGEAGDYDISKTHVIFTAKDPQLPRAMHTRQNIYLVPHDGNDLRQLTSGIQGATRSPVFSPSGDKVAWLELALDGYESDHAKVVIYDLNRDVRFTITEDWDRSPDSIIFSPSSTLIYATTGDHARIKIFAMAIPPTPPSNATQTTQPTALTFSGSISGFTPIPGGRATFALSSLTSPNEVYELSGLEATEQDLLAGRNADAKATLKRLTSFSSAGLQGKDLSPGKDFWFKGTAEGQDTHGYVITPPGFKRGVNGKWPAVMLIHGGPQGAWYDQWQIWCNPNVFASQGYVVVAINPTGSTSFGQKFTDGINKNWGGRPIQDLLMGWKYILQEYPEIDQNRTVAAGGSYGGYAINWIQGNPELGFGFKALVCNNGTFDTTYNGYATDELFFFNNEFGGRPWDPAALEASQKYNPAYTVAKWSTPQLTIHTSKDYRIPESDGIAAFHALQQLGVPSRLLIFTDENHLVINAGNSLKWHHEVFRWFNQFIGLS
ncbi:alpha beta-hydrolase [Suillus brevipes Sb2]|nr:alpha beta-hydrolase [Suillus brevipes Sb2]